MNKKSIPNFLDVFEKRIDRAREKIKEELKKDKKDRDRHSLKTLLKDIKEIRRSVKEAKQEHNKTCPHCGGPL
jgi:hypothetical protein